MLRMHTYKDGAVFAHTVDIQRNTNRARANNKRII